MTMLYRYTGSNWNRTSQKFRYARVQEQRVRNKTTAEYLADNGSKRLIRSSISATVFASVVGVIWYTQQWRREKLKELPHVTSIPQRTTPGLMRTLERTCLLGNTDSVKEELESIRRWHIEHGYKGGLVLRELTKPLFVKKKGKVMETLKDPWRRARRECYYLYYEITGTGEIRQQIFCRGTTIAVDVLTCLSLWMVHDEELGCRIHQGFRDQAERILEDIQPLLAPASDERSTIEISGHSLGGSVAYIIAAKLKKRGYRVSRVTSVCAPRFCASSEGASMILSELPHDNLRIENDTDPIPFMPPFGYHVGDKLLYLVDESGKVSYIQSDNSKDKESLAWVENIFINFCARLNNIVMARGQPHRITETISHVANAFLVQNQKWNEKDVLVAKERIDGNFSDSTVDSQ